MELGELMGGSPGSEHSFWLIQDIFLLVWRDKEPQSCWVMFSASTSHGQSSDNPGTNAAFIWAAEQSVTIIPPSELLLFNYNH